MRDREGLGGRAKRDRRRHTVLCSPLDTVLLENIAVYPAFHRLGIGELLLHLAVEWARVAGVPELRQWRHDHGIRRLPRARLPKGAQRIQRRSPAACLQKCCQNGLRVVKPETLSDGHLVAILHAVPEPNSGQILELGSRSAS